MLLRIGIYNRSGLYESSNKPPCRAYGDNMEQNYQQSWSCNLVTWRKQSCASQTWQTDYAINSWVSLIVTSPMASSTVVPSWTYWPTFWASNRRLCPPKNQITRDYMMYVHVSFKQSSNHWISSKHLSIVNKVSYPNEDGFVHLASSVIFKVEHGVSRLRNKI